MPRISKTGSNDLTYDPNQYVTHKGFGLDPDAQPDPGALLEVYENLESTDTIFAEIKLREAYDTKYGIHDHRINEQPFSPFRLVRFHEKEDLSTTTLLDYYVERYHGERVREHFGYSFSEFLALPVDRADYILEKAHKFSKIAYEAQKAAEENLENTTSNK